MTELESVKQELDRLDRSDKGWILVCGAVAIAAIVTGVLAGSLVGDAISFVVTLGAGFVVHVQWQSLGGKRRAGTRARRAKAPATPRQHRASPRRSKAAK